jgi:oligopeptide transport system substrate-binding protein
MRSYWLRLVAVFLALTLVAAACGGDDDAPVATGDEPAAEEPAPEEPAPEEPMLPTELTGLTVVDDKTFTVSLTEADPEFPLRLSYTGFAPLPSAFYDDPVAFEESPIGNGPFMLDGSWEHDVQVRLVPNPNYAGPVQPQLSSLTFNIYEDVSTTGYLDTQAGVVDVSETVPGDAAATAPDEFGDRYAESPATSFYYYGFPSYLNDQYPLDLRRALSMSVDRELISQVIFDGTTLPSNAAVPPSLAGSRTDVCGNWNYDPAGAQAAFAAYGGLEALGDQQLIVWHNTSETLGISIDNISFENLEFSEYLPLLDEQGVTGPFRLGWGADYLSPLNFLEPLYASYSQRPVSSNSSFYDSEVFDQALADGKAAFAASSDLNDAIPFYQAAETDICENVAILPIHFGKNTYAWTDNIDNVFKNALGNMNWDEMVGGDVTGAIGEPEHLAPPLSNESEGIEVLEAVFSQLVEYDHRTSEPGNVVAESVTTDDGGKTWTIVVADGWTFHNGEAVTASSFVDAWNWTATGANAAANNGFFGVVDGWDDMNPPSDEG